MKGILKYTRWLWSHSVGARVAILVNILLGKATEENDFEQYDFKAADVNGDGTATISDVTALVNRLLGKWQ